MQRLLLHGTLVLVVLLLSAAACHAEEAKASVLAESPRKTKTTKEEGYPDDEEEEEEGGDVAEGVLREPKTKSDLLLGAGSRMMLTNAFQSPSSNASESSDDAKQREMAQRVRELLSRLPIIPLSQKPVLHKETLVAAPAAAPTIAAHRASDDTAAAVTTTPLPASQTASAIFFRDPAGTARAAHIEAPLQLDKSAFIPDELIDKDMQAAPAAAPVSTLPYSGRAITQSFPMAFNAGQQVEYILPGSLVPYADRSGDNGRTSGTTAPQPGTVHPSLADISHDELQTVNAQNAPVPAAEFVQLFDVMSALSMIAEWISGIKQDTGSGDSDTRGSESGEMEENAGREEQVENPGATEAVIKEQGGERGEKQSSEE